MRPVTTSTIEDSASQSMNFQLKRSRRADCAWKVRRPVPEEADTWQDKPFKSCSTDIVQETLSIMPDPIQPIPLPPAPMPPQPEEPPIREPEPDRLPDELPNPNPDETPAPPQRVFKYDNMPFFFGRPFVFVNGCSRRRKA